MSFAPEVIADSSGKFVGNALRFATLAEADRYVSDLSMRWTAVRETRVTESSDPVNYAFDGGRLEAVCIRVGCGHKASEHEGSGPCNRKNVTENGVASHCICYAFER